MSCCYDLLASFQTCKKFFSVKWVGMTSGIPVVAICKDDANVQGVSDHLHGLHWKEEEEIRH